MTMLGDDNPVCDVAAVEALEREDCTARWRQYFGKSPPKYISLRFMRRALAHEMQLRVHGGHAAGIKKALNAALIEGERKGNAAVRATSKRLVATRPGTHLVREWNGRTYRVEVLEQGFLFDGKIYGSLSGVALRITGTRWSGPRFFGLAS